MDEDLIGGCLGGLLLVILAGAAIIAGLYISFWLAIGLLGIGLVTGTLLAFPSYLWAYLNVFYGSISSSPAPVFKNEPAEKGYFFGPSYSQMKTSLSAALPRIKRYEDFYSDCLNYPMHWSLLSLKAWPIGSVIGHYVGFLLASLFLSISQGIILVFGTLFSGISMALLSVSHTSFRYIWRIGYPCPSCYARGQDPVFICPTCGERHEKLRPNTYGVLKHTCKCGASLPTIKLLGKKNIPAICRECNTPLTEFETTDIHLAFAGGPASGKSNLFYQSLDELMKKAKNAGYQNITFGDSTQDLLIGEEFKRLKSGNPTSKTAEKLPKGVHVIMKHPVSPVKKSIYFYDVAGETFLTGDESSSQRFYGHIDGLVLVIDPLSIAQVKNKYKDQIDKIGQEIVASTLDPEEVFSRLIRALEAYVRGGLSAIRSARVSVVISKVDLFDFEQSIMDFHNKNNQNNENKPVVNINDNCKNWLTEQGLGNLVSLIESHFKNVRYFPVSALGRQPDQKDNSNFVPKGVFEPISWALSRRIQFKEKENE